MMPDRVGQQLGNYRLIRLIGRGGFADVYLGTHVRLNVQAAIKVLHTHLPPEDVEHFQKEAQMVAGLVHPHIVRVFDFDVQHGVAFLVMDYAPNGSLRQQHARGVCKVGPGAAFDLRKIALADRLAEFLLDQPRQLYLREFTVQSAQRSLDFPQVPKLFTERHIAICDYYIADCYLCQEAF